MNSNLTRYDKKNSMYFYIFFFEKAIDKHKNMLYNITVIETNKTLKEVRFMGTGTFHNTAEVKTWVITYKFYDDESNRCVCKKFFDSFSCMTNELYDLISKGFECNVTKYDCSLEESMKRWS